MARSEKEKKPPADRVRGKRSVKPERKSKAVRKITRTPAIKSDDNSLPDVQDLKRLEKQLRDSEVKYRRLFETAQDAILILDGDTGQILDANPFIKDMLGYTIEEMVGKNLWEIGLFKDIVANKDSFDELKKKGYIRYEHLPLEARDGRHIDVEFVSNRYRVNSHVVFQCNIRDITERKRLEKQLTVINRLYSLISEANQVIVRIKNRDELFQSLCRIAVETGKFRMAWIGLIDNQSGRIQPAAWYGHEDGYLNAISISIEEEPNAGRPTLMAISEGKIAVCNNIEQESSLVLWRDEALKRGYGSLAAIPLKMKNKIIGNFNIYSDATELFSDEEKRLLAEIGDDISYALDSMEIEKEKQKAEEALVREKEFIDIALDSQHDTFFIFDPTTGKAIKWNKAFRDISGYTDEEITSLKAPDSYYSSEDLKKAAFYIESLRSSLEGKIELSLICKDGHKILSEYQASFISNSNGEPQYIISIGRDITERKRAEETLQYVNNLLAETQALAMLGGWEYDAGTGEITWTKEVYRIYGVSEEYNPNEIDNDISFYTDVDRTKIEAAFKRAVELGEPYDLELKFNRATGEQIWVRTVGKPVMENGKVVRVTGNFMDITDRKRMEEGLKANEAKYHAIFNNAAEGVFQSTLEGKYISVNPAFARIVGFSSAEDVINSVSDIQQQMYVHPEDRTRLIELVNSQGSVSNFECEVRRKDGLILWISINIRAVKDGSGKTRYLEGTINDITQRKRAEQALRESEERFSIAFHNSPIGITINHIKEGIFIVVNDAFLQICGYEREEVIGHSSTELQMVSADNRDSFVNELRQRGKILNHELTLRTKTGEIRHISFSGQIITIGGDTYSLGLNIDITERKQAEEALRESEEQFRLLMENANDAIFIHEVSLQGPGKFIQVNEKACAMLGYTREELVQMSIPDIDVPEQRDRIPAIIDKLYETGQAVFETEHLCKDGGRVPVEISTRLIKIRGRDLIFSIVRDITDRKHLEEERLRIDKLQSVGILAGGIAHDFNNILTAILGNINLASIRLARGENAESLLKEAETASLRAKGLTQQLLTFARGGMPVKKIVSIGNLIKETANFALRGSNVNCRFSIPDDLWPVDADEGQINQVINNLVINARQAMPMGGAMEIKAENINLDEGQTLGRRLPLETGDYVRITVTDHGIGIPAQYIDQIFDPYYTTKQTGSGLGLATSFSIIRNHQGHIGVESVVNEGTTFYVYLPASEKQVVAAIGERAAQKPALTGRILVMDDEDAIRDVAGAMLRHIGFSDVTLTVNGQQAVNEYQEAMKAGRPFVVVILDLTIPGGMGGRETIQKLLKIDPGVKAIVSSGYSGEDITAEYQKYGFKGIVSKPYTLEQLSDVLGKVIGGDSTIRHSETRS